MTSVAARRERRGRSVPRAAVRLVAFAPLASIFLWLCVVYGWQASHTRTAFFFYDELLYAELSRSISETGHAALRGHPASFTTLYSYVLAPVWRLHDAQASYDAAKLIGVLAMTSVVFPAYGLARGISSKRAALFAAAGSALIPSLVYSSMLMTEVVAYPFAALCFLAALKAMTSRRPAWIAAAAALCVVAPLVRAQLIVVPVAAAAAALLFVGTSAPARAWLRERSPVVWVGLALAVAAALVVGDLVLDRVYGIWSIATHQYPGRSVKYGLWALGSLAIGLGVLPVVAALAALVPPRGSRWTPAERAFAALLVSNVVAFGIYTGVKAAYLASFWKTIVEERNVIYLSPLVLAGMASWLGSRRPRLVAVAVSAALVAGVLAVTPLKFDYPSIEGLGLSVPDWAHSHLGTAAGLTRWVMLAVLAGSVVLVVAVGRRPDTRAARAAAWTFAVLVLAWNGAGELAGSHYARGFSTELYSTLPRPLDWVDRATHGARTIYLTNQVVNPNGLHLTEFWNRSIDVVSNVTGDPYPGPGPVFATAPQPRDGALQPDPGDVYAVAEAGIVPVGKVVEQREGWNLFKLQRPLRLAYVQNGVDPDGWAGARSSYAQYSNPGRRPGMLSVFVSRAGWHGRDVGGRVIVRVSPGSRRFSKPIHSGTAAVFRLPVPRPPFSASVFVTRTFIPSRIDPTAKDNRVVGAQVSFGFTPQ